MQYQFAAFRIYVAHILDMPQREDGLMAIWAWGLSSSSISLITYSTYFDMKVDLLYPMSFNSLSDRLRAM